MITSTSLMCVGFVIAILFCLYLIFKLETANAKITSLRYDVKYARMDLKLAEDTVKIQQEALDKIWDKQDTDYPPMSDEQYKKMYAVLESAGAELTKMAQDGLTTVAKEIVRLSKVSK